MVEMRFDGDNISGISLLPWGFRAIISSRRACHASILVLIYAFFSLLFCQTIRYAAELNHIPLGCRTVALGNAGVAIPYSGYCAFWNPSLPSCSDKREVWLEGAKLYNSLSNLGSASFTAPVQNGLNLGAIYTAFLSGDITEWDSLEGTPLERLYNSEMRPDGNDGNGIFHNNHNSIIVSMSKMFSVPIPRPSGFSVPLPFDILTGLNFKYYWQTMTPADKVRMGMNVNIDIGICLRLGASYDIASQSIVREVIMAAAVKDVLPTRMMWINSYSDYDEPVHSARYYGLSYIDRSGFLKAHWTVVLALQRSYQTTVHAGLEGLFWDLVALRVGISDKTPSIGAGIQREIFFLDYAFTFDEIAFTPLRLDLGFKF